MKNILIFLFFIVFGWIPNSDLYAQQKEKIKILNSNSLEYSKDVGEGVRRFIGNVIFEHNNATMYCDSAYIFSNQNLIHAFSNVHVVRGDSLHLYGDFMLYSGDTDIGKVRYNVKLEDKETTLYTDSLNFNTATNVAYYFDGGEIINNENTITSIIGYYYGDDDLFFYKDSVVVTTPDYTIYTDTLKYNTITKKSYFYGPTDIISDSNYIYCENGWYSNVENIAQFNKNAFLESKEHTLKGDSLYYERNNGLGKGFNNVEIRDTVQNLILMRSA